jgi:GT2 family glycosyltransferase
MKKEKIGCVVVTYNRKQLLYECLSALLKQSYPIDEIFLIDNASTDGTQSFLEEKGIIHNKEIINEKEFQYLSYNNITKVNYTILNRNIGGAGGFNEGLQRAIKKDFDWIWLLDDDAEPEIDALEKLLSFKDKNKASFLAPLILNKFSQKPEFSAHKLKIDFLTINEKYIKSDEIIKPIYKLEANSFVGPLLKKEAVKRVGSIDTSFFILYDDTDYTYRLFRFYGPGYLITESIIYHKTSPDNKIPKWKKLYGMRNKIRFFKKKWKTPCIYISIFRIYRKIYS